MIKQKELITGILKDLVYMLSPDYLLKNSKDIYTHFSATLCINDRDCAIINRLLTEALPEIDWTNFSCGSLYDVLIKKCNFDKKTADELVGIMSCVYTDDVLSFWKDRNYPGLLQFLKEKLYIEWEGSFENGKGQEKVKNYYAAFVLIPVLDSAENNELLEILKNNPKMTKKDVQRFFVEKVCTFLDEVFEFFFSIDLKMICADDFPIGMYLNIWCDNYGFEVFDYNGKGESETV